MAKADARGRLRVRVSPQRGRFAFRYGPSVALHPCYRVQTGAALELDKLLVMN